MAHRGLTGAGVAREIDTTQPWVSMVLNGKRDPGMTRSADVLDRLGWELQLVPSGEGDPVRRRDFLLAAASATFVPSPSASPYTDAAYVTRLTDRLVNHEGQLGGAPLAREALRHARRLSRVLRSTRDRELQAAASRLCRQAALIMHDVRDYDRAEHLAGMALTLARRAGESAVQAHAYDTLSLIAAYDPDGRGAEYARRGLKVADTSTDRAMLAVRHGRALALSSDQVGARRSFEDALKLVPGGPLAAEIYGNAGIGLTDLGMPRAAESYLATAVDLTASTPFIQSLYLARQTKTAVRAQDPDAAAPMMTALVAVAPMVDSPRLFIHLRHLIDATSRWAGIPDVRDARDALQEVTGDRRPDADVRAGGLKRRTQGRHSSRRWTW